MKKSLLMLCALACTVALALADDVLPKIEPITKLKPLCPRTALVEDGAARAFIVVPDGSEYAALAQRLQQAIAQAAGATLPVTRAAEVVDADWRVDFAKIAGRNMVALGNVNNNRLLSRLYGEHYVVADSIYPGKGGYVVRTVHDPFAKRVNVLALAGSDADGVAKAIAVFCKKYLKPQGKTLALAEPVIDVEFEKKAYRFFPDATHYLSSKRQPQYTGMAWFKERCQKAGFMDDAGKVVACTKEKTTLVPLVGMIGRIGQTYFRRGDRELLPLMKALLDKNRRLLTIMAPVHDMGGRSSWAVHQWDLLEELPIWTDRDRLDITNALQRDAARGCERRAFHKQVKDGAVQALDENHGTCSALRSFEAWHYFDKYYPSPASDYWMRCAKAVFSAQASTYQILEDSCGYLCYCPIQTMHYALRSGDLTYFKRGVMMTHAQYIATACINNLGLPTGFGDASGVVQPAFFEALAPAAWFYRDARLYWIVRNYLPQACGLRIFQNCIAIDLTVEPRVPTEWTGLIRVPLYEAPLAKGDAVKTPVFADKKELDPKLFNKIVFKENWSPEGQYLLLDGAGAWRPVPGPHGHKHNDINTIINFTSHGRMWLVDHTYQVRGFEDHSGLFVTRNGQGGYRKRTLATLERFCDAGDYGLTRSTFVNTDRAIFWRKGRYFVVVDQAVADQDGDFFARCSFRTLGEETLDGRTLSLAQKGRFCKIVSDGGASLDVETYEYANRRSWQTFYPYAKPVVKIFQQDKARTLKKGETIGFVNLLYACGDEAARDAVQMAAASETCALVADRGKKALLGVGAMPGGLGAADMFVLSDETLIALGADALPAGLARANAPCDWVLDLAHSRLRIKSAQPVTVTLAGRAASAQDAGERVIRLDGWDGLARAKAAVANAIAAAEADVAKRATGKQVEAKEEISGLAVSKVKLASPANRIVVADIDGGGDEWIAADAGGVTAYRPDGAKLWAFATKQPVHALDVGDVDGDGQVESVAGCDDTHVYLLDRNGRQKWAFECGKSAGSIDRAPRVDFVKIDDLDRDGQPEIVVGANWVHVLDANGKVKWEKYMAFRRGRICGDFVAGAVTDINGDGKDEVIAAFMTSYPLLQVFDAAGKKIVPAGKTPHGGLNIDVPIDVTALDLFGGQAVKEIVYCAKSRIGFFWQDQKYREQAGGKVGGPFVAMSYLQPDPAKPPMIFGANAICAVVGIAPRPKRNDRWIVADIKWYRTLGEKVSALLAADVNGDGQGAVYVGTKAGNVYVLRPQDGVVLGSAKLHGARINSFTPDPKAKRMLAATAGGNVLVIALAPPTR